MTSTPLPAPLTPLPMLVDDPGRAALAAEGHRLAGQKLAGFFSSRWQPIIEGETVTWHEVDQIPAGHPGVNELDHGAEPRTPAEVLVHPEPLKKMIHGDALEELVSWEREFDLIVTDPPYAFGGSGNEHALSATVAVVLREAAMKMTRGSWMVVFAASSWRSTSYMVEALRGVLDPVRVGTWTKPESRTKVSGPGWQWATVFAIAFRKGRSRDDLTKSLLLDHIEAPVVKNGRRAELPTEVADWAVQPFAVPGGVFLDPFAGSGALVDAAERSGMRAVGFEKHMEAVA